MRNLLIVLVFISTVAKGQFIDSSAVSIRDYLSSSALSINSRVKQNLNNGLISYVPPAVCITYGFVALHNHMLRKVDLSVYNDMKEDHPGFRTGIDNYLQYTPLLASYVLNFSGVHGKNSMVDQTALSFLSLAVAKGSAWLLKDKIRQLRPNAKSYSSFPSGHTTTAFAAAEIVNQEFGDRSMWYGVAAYSVATATGILRVYNNAHWFSNVIAGAGLGVLSVKATYALYPHLKNLSRKNRNISLSPYYSDKATGLSLSAIF